MATTRAMRLLRAELIEEDGSVLDVDFDPPTGTETWTTLVTGRNGSGKSRLLSAIASAFDTVDGNKPRRPVNVSVQYTLEGHDCAIHLERKRASAFLDGKVVPIDALPRPRAVVAATASAFDKFDLPTPQDLFGEPAKRPGLYRYLGLKDRQGRISSKAGIIRALQSLFEATGFDTDRTRRIAHVFEYLGYEPRIEVLYQWTPRGRSFLKAGESAGPDGYRSFLESERAAATRHRPILGEYFFDGPSAIAQLGAAADSLQLSSHRLGVDLVADFSAPRWSEEQRFRQAQQLSRAQLLKMDDVRLRRSSSGSSINADQASSGELAIATTMLGLVSSVDDTSLILIDEPEISLHPEWQADYLMRLAQTFQSFAGCHFVLATHSATLVSGAHPDLSNTLNIETSMSTHDEVAPGKSADEILVRTFGVAQDGNLYVRQLLIEALRLVSDRRTSELRFSEVLGELRRVDRMLPASSRMRQVIADLWRTQISSDGASK